MRQKELCFWGPGQTAPSRQDRLTHIDSFMSKFIGNEQTVRRIKPILFEALGNKNHRCDTNIALLGPSSTGKTTLARLFAKCLGLPFLEIQPKSVKGVADLVAKADDILAGHGCPLMESSANHFKFPPIIIFIDEVHALSSGIVDALLKAIEQKDRVLATESGEVVDCSNVCWVIATTERGRLFHAFDNRFRRMYLSLPSKDEMASIVKLNNEDWGPGLCSLITNYCGHVPREALDFAKEVRATQGMRGGDWRDTVAEVAENIGIDPQGMTYQRLRILQLLGQGKIAKANLAPQIGVQEEELVKYIMPPLLFGAADCPAMVKTSSRGYAITESGINELDLRDLPHRERKSLAA